MNRKALLLLPITTMIFVHCQGDKTPTIENPTQEMATTTVDKGQSTIFSPDTVGQTFYIGTYTQNEGFVDGKGTGIYRATLKNDGSVVLNASYPAGINPSYINVHPSKKFLYAVNETGGTAMNAYGSILGFSITESKDLSLANEQSVQGVAPCYISTTGYGTHLFAANYTSGSISAFTILIDGKIGPLTDLVRFSGNGPNKSRQELPHAHFIAPGPDTLIYATDLGTDKIRIYKLVANKFQQVDEVQCAAGAGPRHLAFHPTLPIFYALNELNGTIESFVSKSGKYKKNQTISNVGDKDGTLSNAGDIVISSDGRFMYASNRADFNSIAVYNLDNEGGMKMVQEVNSGGLIPRNICIDPSGKFLLVANQNSNNIVSFTMNQQDGTLVKSMSSEGIMTPVCIAFL